MTQNERKPLLAPCVTHGWRWINVILQHQIWHKQSWRAFWCVEKQNTKQQIENLTRESFNSTSTNHCISFFTFKYVLATDKEKRVVKS